MHPEKEPEFTAGIGIGSDGGVGIPAFVVALTNPSVVNLTAEGANKFETKASIFAFAGAIGDKSEIRVFRAAWDTGRINRDRGIRGRSISLIEGINTFSNPN